MADEPLLRVVKGDPTDEELAALVVALVTASRPAEPEPPEPESVWASRRLALGLPPARGPQAWRLSGR